MGSAPSKFRPARGGRKDNSAFALLAVAVLAAILSVIGVPAYRSYTLRSHNRVVEAVLTDALRREHQRLNVQPHLRLLSMESLGFPAAAVYVSSDGSVRDGANSSSIYRVSLSYPSAPAAASCGLVPPDQQMGFVLVAEPVQTQRLDGQCASLCLGSDGQQGATGSAGAGVCWGQQIH